MTRNEKSLLTELFRSLYSYLLYIGLLSFPCPLLSCSVSAYDAESMRSGSSLRVLQ